MNYLSQYIVPYYSLDNKEYKFDFKVTDEFFSFFENSTIEGGNIDVELRLIKKTGSMQLEIYLKGTVKILCDRCLEMYDQSIEFCDSLSVEFGNETNFDTNSDIVIVDKDKSEIDISQFIYEFANFALPLQHYHPDDKDGNPGCDAEMLNILDKHLIAEEEEIIDPRWDALKELKK